MKSKGGTNNTYLRGDLNAIPYGRMAEHSGTVEYFRKWIAFRLSELGRYVRLDSFPGNGYFITSRNDVAFGIIYNAGWLSGSERLLFVMNPGYEYRLLQFTDNKMESFEQISDTERWGDPVLEEPKFAMQGETVSVPPLSCGLFVERK